MGYSEACPMITLKGVLTRLTYQNPENHYTVGKLLVAKIAEPITVVGHLAGVAEGESLVLKGKWTSHAKYGDQFSVEIYEVALPATLSGIRKYLGSGTIAGINQTLADRIVDTFEDQTLEIIENEPERLLDVYGIGKAKKEIIEKAWNTHHSVRRVMQFLQEKGVGAAHAGAILKAYGPDALTLLETDPYCIARGISGMGFRDADTIARASGIDREDEKRLAACLAWQLAQYEQDGHVYGLKTALFEDSARLAGVDPDLFGPALDSLVLDGEVVVVSRPCGEEDSGLDSEVENTQDRVYLAPLFRAESGIASRIKALGSIPMPDHVIDEDRILEEVLARLAVRLSKEQLDVVSRVLAQKISVITGGPGTGKTTLVRALCTVFKHLGLSVVLSAPTGRAARRLSQVTGKKAFTLHKLLGYDQDSRTFGRNFTNPLDLDVFVVDEASMVDTCLMFHLIEAMPAMAILILVGDTFQLPSVGPGNVLSDIMESGRVAVFPLTRIFRQAKESPIVMHAHSIRNGEMPDLKDTAPDTPSEFYFIENQNPAKVVETISELCANRIPKAFPHIEEVQVLTPMHKGEAGTINLNQKLQAVLNSAGGGIESRGYTFKPGDKVIHLKNNYEKEVFNGDIGLVHGVSKSKGNLMVSYDGRLVTYDMLELDELGLAYAISVHKSQGSEYGAVIIALTTAHFPLLQRNLLYTALTRGKHLVIIVGSSRALEIAFNNDRAASRFSGLKEGLMAP